MSEPRPCTSSGASPFLCHQLGGTPRRDHPDRTEPDNAMGDSVRSRRVEAETFVDSLAFREPLFGSGAGRRCHLDVGADAARREKPDLNAPDRGQQTPCVRGGRCPSAPMPGDDGFGGDDDKRRPPVTRDSENQTQSRSVEARQPKRCACNGSSMSGWCPRFSSCKAAGERAQAGSLVGGR